MRVLGRNVLSDFARKHGDVSSQIDSWFCDVQDAEWQKPAELKQRYPHASILTDNRVIFNLKGNHYRLEVKVNYTTKVVLVKRIGTHSEYSKWTF